MAQLGRLIQTVIDTIGNAVSGQSVTVYRRGAHANGSSSGTTPLTITVNNPGRIVAGDTVIIDGGSTSYSVDSVTDTTVVVSGFAGTLAVTDDQRITPTNSKPTLYVDAFAGESISNPLTTTATGLASCWLPPGFVDVILSGSGITTTVIPDVLVVGQGDRVNVQWFGAVGDGSTDDTAAIQAAIDYASNRDLKVVYLPPGRYVASQLELKTEVDLIGAGVHTSSSRTDTHGVFIDQKSGTNLDLIVTDTSLAATGFQHWSTIANLSLQGASGATAGAGIRLNSRSGEGFKLEHLLISDFADSGVEAVEGFVPLYAEDIHLFNNGQGSGAGYGMDLTWGVGDSAAMVVLNHISGDNNEDGLIRIKGGTADSCVVMTGIKSEITTAGKQTDTITLEDLNNMPVFVNGVHQTASTATNSIFKIVTSSARLVWTAVRSATATAPTYLLDDTANSHTIAASAAGSNDYSAFGCTFPMSFNRVAAATIAQAFRIGADTVNRFQVAADGKLSWGSGSAGVDTNLYRSEANVLKSDDIFETAGHLRIADGVTAPGTIAGVAGIYVDTSDGDLKVKFGDGTVKTIVTDT